LRYEFREFVEVMDILGDKLGPLIFQFPFLKLCVCSASFKAIPGNEVSREADCVLVSANAFLDSFRLRPSRPSGRYVLFISTEDAQLNVGRVLVRMSRGGQAVPLSSVIDSYGESTKNFSQVLNRADELILYDNTAHRRGFRVVAQFIGGNLRKTAQTTPDWVARGFGKELAAAKQHERSGPAR
jgi:hypothetical protein